MGGASSHSSRASLRTSWYSGDMKTVCLLLTALFVSQQSGASDFDSLWHDGKAEVTGYRLVVSRYGQDRIGQAVLVYVTEPFSETKRVKTDRSDIDGKNLDTFQALKLNFVRDFQTGIYPYKTMHSLFVRADSFLPVKATFSSTEWCGHVFEELIINPDKITGQYHSYFEDESGPINLKRPAGGMLEEELFIALRGLRGEFLKDGESKRVPLLPSAIHRRFGHKPIAWTSATISRKGEEYIVKMDDGRSGKFVVERAYPHRIKEWELWPDVKAEMTGSIRTPYWQQNHNGDERLLKEIGIQPVVP
jgi:hypothetical protein